jgi:hypothetical protein
MKKNFVILIIFSGFIFVTGCDSTDVQEEKKLKLWTDKISYFISDSTYQDTITVSFFNGTDSIVYWFNPINLLDRKTDSGWVNEYIGDIVIDRRLNPGELYSIKCCEWEWSIEDDGIFSYQCAFVMDTIDSWARYIRSNEFTLKKS